MQPNWVTHKKIQPNSATYHRLKQKNLRILLYFGYLLELLLEIWQTRAIFFFKNPLYVFEIMLFKLKTCENSPPKETLLLRDVLASRWSKPIPLKVASTKLHQWIPHAGRFWSSWWIKLHVAALVASSCLDILQNKT